MLRPPLAFGGGIKYAIDNRFSIGAEYLHLDFDTKTFSFGPLAALPPGTAQFNGSGNIVKISVDYKIGGLGYEPLK
ncbi:MAG TPA: hypothetical protein VE986_05485 [Hyphomicrobiales bacterium]|nr:hypothetical protein [Hyphomicrobiales bacterium]